MSGITEDLICTFRTFNLSTCNRKCKEIENELCEGQKATERHDIIAKVFKLKVDKLMRLINDYKRRWRLWENNVPHAHY